MRLTRHKKESYASILGIDASLTSTGYAYRLAGEVYTGTITCGALQGPYRLSYMRRKMEEVLAIAKPSMVVIEDYAMGKVGRGGSRAFHIGELGGVYKMIVWDMGIDIMLVSPTALKACIVGNGAAKGKEVVMDAIETKFGYSFTQNDEADAFGLMAMGEVRSKASTFSPELIKQLRPNKIAEYAIIKGRLLTSISK